MPAERAWKSEGVKLSVEQSLRKARGLSRDGDNAAAEHIYRDILGCFPGNKTVAAELHALSSPKIENPPEAELEQLLAVYNARRWTEAVDRATALVARYPNGDILHNIAGAVHAGMGHFEAAIVHYDRAIALAPDFIEAINNRGIAQLNVKREGEALTGFDEAIRLKADYVEAHINRGIALGRLGRSEEAVAAFDRAINLDPGQPEAYNNRANLLLRGHRLADAVRDYERAIRLRPTYAEAHLNLGNALKMLRRADAAVASYDRAICLSPALVEAHLNRATALRALKRPEEALAGIGEALRLKPDHASAYGELLDLEAHLCRWTNAPRDEALLNGAAGGHAIPPFYSLHLFDEPQRQLIAARNWAKEKFGGIGPEPIKRRVAGEKTRLGYFSADFHNHATMYLMARLFELHDRETFEVHAFSYGPCAQDEMRARLLNAVDAFHEVGDLDDREIARLARGKRIDIAVDLKGYTENGRAGIFAHRAAPVQVSYLGYPGSMGADFIDYIIADPIVIPPDAQPSYSEKILYLPNSYQVNDSIRAISEAPLSRTEAGLPEHGFVFCCFNNNYKITPVEFDIWMRLLLKIEGSVLWLLRDSDYAADNLRREARSRGVDPSRLVFAKRAPLADHLARHRCADLFLDTFNVNAHTTASDALWAGLPVITKLGESFAARVAGSLLHGLNVPELVTTTSSDYEALALDLASDPAKLVQIKHKIAEHRMTAPLFDTERFTRDIEAIYKTL